MSRGQTPRTPEYFPRMNDRAGRRPIRRAKDPEERIQLLWKRCKRSLVKAMLHDVKDLARALRSRRFAEGGEVKGPRPDYTGLKDQTLMGSAPHRETWEFTAPLHGPVDEDGWTHGTGRRIE